MEVRREESWDLALEVVQLFVLYLWHKIPCTQLWSVRSQIYYLHRLFKITFVQLLKTSVQTLVFNQPCLTRMTTQDSDRKFLPVFRRWCSALPRLYRQCKIRRAVLLLCMQISACISCFLHLQVYDCRRCTLFALVLCITTCVLRWKYAEVLDIAGSNDCTLNGLNLCTRRWGSGHGSLQPRPRDRAQTCSSLGTPQAPLRCHRSATTSPRSGSALQKNKKKHIHHSAKLVSYVIFVRKTHS